MNRFWKSTEFYFVLALWAWLACQCKLPVADLAYRLNALAWSYVIGRMLWKKNRGMFHAGAKTSEFGMTVLTVAWNLWAGRHGLDGGLETALQVLDVGVYCLCRGMIKGIGVKTQSIFR